MAGNNSRANFRYASDLRKKGFPTVIHALSPDTIAKVNELLANGWKGIRISNYLNSQYSEEISERNLKPISRKAIETYREKYWKKSPAFSNLILQGDHKTRQEIESLISNFDAYKELISLAKLQIKRVNQAREIEVGKPMTFKNVRDEIETGIKATSEVISREIDLGIRQRATTFVDSHISGAVDIVETEMTEEYRQELLSRIGEAGRAIGNTGEYAEPEITGEDMSKFYNPCI